MNVNLQYVASSGNVYNLKSDGIRTKKANYHKWNWGVNGTTLQYGIRVSDFNRKPATYETELIFTGSYNMRKTICESLHEDFELDVRKKTMGKIIWGDYYIDCYITASSTYPDTNDVYTDNEITIYAPYPFWVHEETKSFSPQEEIQGQTFLDYPYGYKYDYYFIPGFMDWIRDFPFESEFKMVIYGPCANPQVTINGYLYKVFDTLGDNEYIVIDSRSNTVFKYTSSNLKINIFDQRNKQQSVFKQIPGENLTLNWPGNFGFDLTLFEERSEPRWDDNRYADLVGNNGDLQVERWQ